MRNRHFKSTLLPILLLLLTACSTPLPMIPVDRNSANPGGTVTRGGTTRLQLLGEPIKVGSVLPSTTLVDINLNRVDLSTQKGAVLFLSIVPSLDTKVCERQTHILAEEGKNLPEGIRLITISRDLPFAQKRFAEESGLHNIEYLSDFQKADFGKGTGLLVDGVYLLARAVILIDREGVIRYIQVVPELSHLPDMEKAFEQARELQLKP